MHREKQILSQHDGSIDDKLHRLNEITQTRLWFYQDIEQLKVFLRSDEVVNQQQWQAIQAILHQCAAQSNDVLLILQNINAKKYWSNGCYHTHASFALRAHYRT